MKKTTKLKLTRSIFNGDYCLWGSRGGYLKSYCPRDWHRLTGIRLKKNEECDLKLTQLKKGFKIERIQLFENLI